MKRLLRYWFTFEQSVGRGQYLAHGAALMTLKYASDAALIWLVAGIAWTPADYLTTGAELARSKLSGAPGVVPVLLSLWTLPFLWIGLTMTSRRALDAGVSPWFSLTFFVPVVNYVAMALLCVLPTAALRDRAKVEVADNQDRSAIVAVGAGAFVGSLLTIVSVLALRSYGASLFLGTPFMMGATTAYVLNHRQPVSLRETLWAVASAVAVTAAALIAFAVEGAICLIMALPLALAIAWLGALTGRFIASRENSLLNVAVAVLLVPVSTPIVDSRAASFMREVRSTVEIQAPPDVVWRSVVSFPRISGRPEWLFRLGIAQPLAARIDGDGVGALRYCSFNTGDFVEPITVWEPGRRLAFDITSQPAPMRELSPYAIKPPHLGNYFRATRGEFLLTPTASGGTRVDGSTWYQIDIRPAPYFAVLADFVVERIHRRVLRHIKSVAEGT